MRHLFPALLLTAASPLAAQPDTLYITEHGSTSPYAVVYPTYTSEGDFRLVGRYALDTSRVAVELDHKRGRPCGVYRAYYPDGRPLILAVYGYNGLHGDWTEYDEQGRITVKGQYREGEREGTWAFRAEGIVGHYREGLRHGKWKYFQNGRLVREVKYHKDKLVKGSEMQMGP